MPQAWLSKYMTRVAAAWYFPLESAILTSKRVCLLVLIYSLSLREGYFWYYEMSSIRLLLSSRSVDAS